MEKTLPGRFVPVAEVLQVALAACVIECVKKSREIHQAQWRWTLGASSPMSTAMLAMVRTVGEWTQHHDPERALFVARMYLAFEGRPKESFDSLASRLLSGVALSGGVVFSSGKTFGRGVPYYNMASDAVASRVIRDVSRMQGPLVVAFSNDVAKAFTRLRVLKSEANSMRNTWSDRAVA